MDTSPAPLSLYCPDCAERLQSGAVTVTCPNCDGPVRFAVDSTAMPATLDELGVTRQEGVLRFGPLCEIDLDPADGLAAGGSTPIECPSLAAESGVDTLWIADEGRNPTGSMADREMPFALAAAKAQDADRVVLPSTGHAAQSAAAYAGRAGLDSIAFLPSRTPFLNKAMVNVHGGDLTIVEGRYSDAREAFETAEQGGFPVDPRSPSRRLGAVSLAWELLDGVAPAVPDAVVLPVGHGHRIAGLETGFRALVDGDILDSIPSLYAAQPDGCAPIVDAEQSNGHIDVPAIPDTIVGSLEIPDPVLGTVALEAIDNSDGGAVAIPDEQALAAAVEANATAGIECSVTGGVALAAVSRLVERGELGDDATVLVVDSLAAASESDVLRNHLVSRDV